MSGWVANTRIHRSPSNVTHRSLNPSGLSRWRCSSTSGGRSRVLPEASSRSRPWVWRRRRMRAARSSSISVRARRNASSGAACNARMRASGTPASASVQAYPAGCSRGHRASLAGARTAGRESSQCSRHMANQIHSQWTVLGPLALTTAPSLSADAGWSGPGKAAEHIQRLTSKDGGSRGSARPFSRSAPPTSRRRTRSRWWPCGSGDTRAGRVECRDP